MSIRKLARYFPTSGRMAQENAGPNRPKEGPTLLKLLRLTPMASLKANPMKLKSIVATTAVKI